MDEGKRTFSELIIGIIFLALVITIPGIFIAGNKLAFFLGMLIGTAVAVIMLISMFRSVDKSLDMDTNGAAGYTKRKAFLRILLMAAAVLIAFYASDYISIIGVVVGIFSLKLSAYLQPLTHKLLKNKL